MNQVASLEPVPGIPPTASHLEKLLQNIKATKPSIILRSSYDPDKASIWLSERASIPAIIMPYTVDNQSHKDLFSLFNNSINMLLDNIK